MSDNEDCLEHRIVDLESKNTFQEAELLEISKVLTEQNARIERLEATVRILRGKIKELSGEGQAPLLERERPPHY
jgi:uncharacterized coiled-coil protein SlyX